jgi:glycosyl hydrolase family 113
VTRLLLVVVLLLGLRAAHATPQIRGVALGLYPGTDAPAALREIAALGATHVALTVFWRQHDVRAVELAAAAGLTFSDDALRATIREARAAGLQVFLLPIIDVEVRGPREWRGVLKPADDRAWWNAYEAFILHYAEIAGAEEIALFAVGSELMSTEVWRDRWYHLIGAVKRKYKGPLLYSANWDHFRPVSFWERLDYVGVTGYNELAGEPGAEEAALAERWRTFQAELVTFAKQVERPLVITEVGYTSQRGTAVHPWDYTVRAAVDLEEQRRCYAAFVAAWQGEPALAGVFFWDWNGAGGPSDPHYTPRGKPAEKVLRSWFGMR